MVHSKYSTRYSSLPGFRHDRVHAGIGVGADGVTDDVDSAGSSGVARTPTSLVNGRRKQAEGAVLPA
jgi:hypothetical protein